MALAQWMEDGVRPFDLGDVDIARMHPFQANRTYLCTRATGALGLLYADHFPYRQKETARGIRRSPCHQQLLKHGAVMGEFAGWERANWFANSDQESVYRYSWGRQNWFVNWQQEHFAVRTGVGLYDLSSLGKVLVQGNDAEDYLNRVCGANLSVPVGKIAYTQFLNKNGCIEADVTIAHPGENEYLVVTPAATCTADQAWLRRNIGDANIFLADVTASEAVLAIMGPESRQILSAVSSESFDNQHFPFGTFKHIEIGMTYARAHRISYVGELGYEIYIPAEMGAHVFETMMQAGEGNGLKLCGLHMMGSCRMEKAFCHFGHDITTEDHVLEAWLVFAVDTKKLEFNGRDAVLRMKKRGLKRRLVQFLLTEREPLLYHHESIIRNDEIVGYLTSCSYGHSLGGAIGLGYVPCENESVNELIADQFHIDVAGECVAAQASLRPLFDPKVDRMRC